MVSRKDPVSLTRQCQLLELSRSTFYYQAKPVPEGDLKWRRLIDECHLERPFCGSRRIRD